MARTPRIDGPGLVHHVTLRGVARCDIFRDDQDREEMIRRIDQVGRKLGFRFWAWALMPNHIHLVVEAGEIPLRRFMARLATGYAMYFNRRHGRVGHLFQNRYWSEPIEDEAGLEAVVAYVDQNPLRAGLVASLRELADCRWCGYGARTGARRAYAFERSSSRAKVLRCASRPTVAESKKAASEAPDLKEFIANVCAAHQVSAAALVQGGRSHPMCRARAEIVKTAVLELGLPLSRVALELGVSISAVSQILQRRS